jgi:hypothetical protein
MALVWISFVFIWRPRTIISQSIGSEQYRGSSFGKSKIEDDEGRTVTREKVF